MDHAARAGRVVSPVPGLASYLYQVEHPLLALFERYGIDHALDVGANEGQFSARLRLLGYRGLITSFEPVRAAFERLRKRAAGDRSWRVVRTAVGATSGEADIHVAQETALSSMLSPSARLVDRVHDASVVYSERVPVATLDELVSEQVTGRTFLKIDTQGSEAAVLDGATQVLDTCAGLQLELSLRTPLYEGEASAEQLCERLRGQGFTNLVLNPLVHTIRWGDLVQADAIFWRLRS
jgi:FkbM family methyltransferase